MASNSAQQSRPAFISCKQCRLLLTTIACLIASISYWALRFAYWRSTNEEPFSDMADYLAIAERFRCCWSLSMSDFWVSYMKPTLPALGGLLFSATKGIDLDAWRLSLAFLTFTSLLWLAWEIRIATRSHVYPIGLLFSVSLSKSSIFWSYKFATEGLGEALAYVVCATLLFVFRSKDSGLRSALLGFTATLALYNRPNLAPVMPILAVASSFRASLPRRTFSLRFRNLVGFSLGCSALIIPWVLRSYALYGAILLSPTQGPYSFLWELGAVPTKSPTGASSTRTAQQLQEEAPQLFRNDYEAATYAKSIVGSWISDNWKDLYPRLIRNRFFSTIENREIALSRVPRTKLFSESFDWILLDKSPLLFLLGAFGLLCLALKYGGALYIIPCTALLPWVFGIFFMGDPRMLEPSLPLILFGVFALARMITDLPAYLVRRRSSAATGTTLGEPATYA